MKIIIFVFLKIAEIIGVCLVGLLCLQSGKWFLDLCGKGDKADWWIEGFLGFLILVFCGLACILLVTLFRRIIDKNLKWTDIIYKKIKERKE